MTISSDDRPDRMYRRGRPEDPVFDPEERLFFRCIKLHARGARLDLPAFGFRNWSANREKYSESTDVLIPNYSEHGIASFQVKDIPDRILSVGGPVFEFRIMHVPLEDNYSHSEIWTYKNGQYFEKADVPSHVKTKFRQILSEKAIVLVQPRV